MNQEQFAAIMPYISADLVEMIAKKKSISENDAITKLYNSELYAILEQEDTKVWQYSTDMLYSLLETSVYKGYKQDKIEMRGDRAEMSDFPLYLNTVAGGLDRRDQAIGGFSFVVKIYAVPVVEIIG